MASAAPIAGLLVSRQAARGGDRRDAQRLQLSLFGVDRFQCQQWPAWGLMTLLGFSVVALLAPPTSSAIMAAAPKEKAAAAGRLKPWPMELGAVSAYVRPDRSWPLLRCVWPGVMAVDGVIRLTRR